MSLDEVIILKIFLVLFKFHLFVLKIAGRVSSIKFDRKLKIKEKSKFVFKSRLKLYDDANLISFFLNLNVILERKLIY